MQWKPGWQQQGPAMPKAYQGAQPGRGKRPRAPMVLDGEGLSSSRTPAGLLILL